MRVRKKSYAELEKAYGNLDFIFANKLIRKKIYYDIHEKQRVLFKFIKKEAWDFETYFNVENGNLPVVIMKINEIQNKIFATERTKHSLNVYNQFKYEIEKSLDELMPVMYGKKAQRNIPKYSDYCVYFRWFT